MEDDLQKIRSVRGNAIPMDLLHGLTDLYALDSFVEILVHRRLICSAHVELEDEESIHVSAIPILLPCFALLLFWDGEEQSPSITIHHRVLKQLKPSRYSLPELEGQDQRLTLDQFRQLTITEREQWIFRSLDNPFTRKELLQEIHPDYHLWILIVQYWYSIRHLTPVYLHALAITLIKSVYLTATDEDQFDREDFHPFTISIRESRNSKQIEPKVRQMVKTKLNKFIQSAHQMKKFDCSIIHEFNCLQTIYMYTMKLNDFFHRPFAHRVESRDFLCGSLFYAFVDHYETKRNLNDALRDLFHHDQRLLAIVNKFYALITADPEID